ncbi:GGDEF domain-containing protein [Methylobacillus gramineus]|uniref:GGDEF domain-containing protein n=1 Tax=Methylobacillus gramineus TaxID=755169 RepID=UPI001CFFB8F2|nr:GGDEF domain-containing protein [Methylobacillus gramineus]MCB5184770.1 GGDEF domain-containing protein [Methylobacillus gramineus]
MQLDVKTIFFLTGMLTSTTGLVLWGLAMTGRFDRWLKYWGISNLSAGAGILLLTFRDQIPDFYSIVLANMLTIIGYFLLMVTARRLYRRKVAWQPHLLVLAVMATLFLMMQDSDQFYFERTAISAAICGFYCVLISHTTLAIAREENISSAYLVTGIFSVTALAFGLRMLAALTHHLGGESVFAPGGINMWMILLAAIVAPLWNMSMLMMIMERINRNWIGRALRDPLTSALNRAGLSAAMENAVQGYSDKSYTALLLVDIDHFKQVNDKLGHAYGDELLRMFSDMVRSQLRGSDLFARQGGDEFVILLPGSGEKEGREVAERLQKAFTQSIWKMKTAEIAPTLSIGLAVTKTDQLPQSLHNLLQQADAALYQSKQGGRNRITTVQTA